MKHNRATRIVALILAALLLLGLIVTPALATESESASIGIIGGADGPTAIFVATSPSGIAVALALAAAIVCAVVLIIRKRKK